MNKKILLLMAALSAMMATSACVVEENHPVHTVYVHSAPPAEIVEVQPAPPSEDPYWAWQKGHWRWNGNSYYWVKGHWDHRPERYREWVAPRWESHSSGYVFVEGHWQ